MDLIDEEDVTLFEAGEETSQVAGFLDDGSRSHPDVAFHLISQDEGEAGLAQSGWSTQQDMAEDVISTFGCTDHDLETFDRFSLPGEIIE